MSHLAPETKIDRPVRRPLSGPVRVVFIAAGLIFAAGLVYAASLFREVPGLNLEFVTGSEADWSAGSSPVFARRAGQDANGRYLTLMHSQMWRASTIVFDTHTNTALHSQAVGPNAESQWVDAIRADIWSPDGLFVEMSYRRQARNVAPPFGGFFGGRRSLVSQHWKLDADQRSVVSVSKVEESRMPRRISPDGRHREESIGAHQLWFPDSRRQFRIKPNELAVVDHESGEILWTKSHAALQQEVFGDLGPQPNPPPDSRRSLVPGIFAMDVFDRGDTTAIRLLVVKNNAASPADHIVEQWELIVPDYEWVRLGPGDATFDPTGSFGIVFEEADDSSDGGCRVQRLDAARGSLDLIYEGNSPLPRDSSSVGWRQFGNTVCIVPHPDRVYWISDETDLWMLPLEQDPVPHRVWPPRDEDLQAQLGK